MATIYADHPLKAWLKANGIKRSEFAMMVPVDPSTLSRWTKGGLPKVELMPRIAELTGGAVRPETWYDYARFRAAAEAQRGAA